VHAVFLVKTRSRSRRSCRDTNVKLSGSQQIRGVDDLARGRVPNDTTQKVKKRFVVERVLNMGIERRRPGAGGDRRSGRDPRRPR